MVSQYCLALVAIEPDWFGSISLLVGGLGIFLFGMNELSDGLKAIAGSRLRMLLRRLTDNRLMGAGMGTFLTAIIQSSSATTVILVGLVEAQLLAWQQTLPVILGANIGTTVTAQVIAFKVTKLALLMIGIGLLISMVRKRSFTHHAGRALLALGLVFFGMSLMGDGVQPIKTNPHVAEIFMRLESPLLGILAGFIVTAIVQSSSATMGIIIALTGEGLVGLPAAIALMFGANIGTCVTAWLASLSGSASVKRVAMGHTAFKVCGVLLFVWWIPTFQTVVVRASDMVGVTDAARQVANAHTLFNVAITALFLPLTGLAARGIELVLPDKSGGERKLTAPYLDDALLATPQLAIDGAIRQTRDMGLVVHRMLAGCLDLFHPHADDARDRVRELDRRVDFLENRLRRYLMGISQSDIDREQSHEVYAVFIASNELEHVGDTIMRVIARLAEKVEKRNARFPLAAWQELREYHASVCDNLSLAVQALTRQSDTLALETRAAKADLTTEADRLRVSHFARMSRGDRASIETDDLYMELLDALRQINSSSGKMARPMLTSPVPESAPESAP